MAKMFNINDNNLVRYTNRLEKLHRSDLPIAVRSTLNDMAFDVKSTELLLSAEDHFIVRSPAFFKRFSGVNKADGFDLENMKSEVGITPQGNEAAKNLEKQETGGTIKDRSTIYMDTARVSRSRQKRVRRPNYLNQLKYVKGRPASRRSRKSNFVALAIMAKAQNAAFKIRTRGTETFFKVTNISFVGSGSKRRVNIKMTPIATYDAGRSVKVQKRPFLQDASETTLNKAPRIFIKNAEKRFQKALQV